MEFIIDLLNEFSKIYNLSKTKLLEYLSTEIFDMGKNFLKHIASKIKNKNDKNYSPNYKFSIQTLANARKNIQKRYKSDSPKILKYFNDYRAKNPDLKEYYHEQWKKHNPNLRYRFFRYLDSPVKLYWYGFISADGSITQGNDPSIKRYQISIEIAKRDWKHLVKFRKILRLNTKIGKRSKKIEGKEYELVYIIFTCKPMYEDLINLGLKKLKEGSNVSFKLGNDDLSYSFLLGFYDGEGHEGTTRIYSTNFDLLYQIKTSYALDSKIRDTPVKEVPDELKKHPIDRTKPMYDLALGAELLNRMMASYSDSLARKRKQFSEQLSAMESLRKKVKNRNNLIKLIEENGKEELAKMMKVSFHTLHNLCEEWGIVATKLRGSERLKREIDKTELIKMIENYGIDNTAKKLNVGFRTVKILIKEWEINASYLSAKERLAREIGSKTNMQILLKNNSLTKLGRKYGVGRNTVRRLCDDWGIDI